MKSDWCPLVVKREEKGRRELRTPTLIVRTHNSHIPEQLSS
jgi:hypothetical protein